MVRCALAIAAVLASLPAGAEPLPDATERVIGLGRVWAKAKFFHPYLAYKDIDWDAALVAAIPKAEAATTTDEYRAAVDAMLKTLGDPVTRVMDPPTPRPAAAAKLALPPGVVELKVAELASPSVDLATLPTKVAQIAADAAKATVLVVDLRGP